MEKKPKAKKDCGRVDIYEWGAVITPPKITREELRRVIGHLSGKKNKGKTSPAKAAAARVNGKRGGRPPKRQMELKLQA
jgi:hypothetical protein